MSGRTLKLGFVPLNDAAALIVGVAQGFFAEQGLDVELSREASWATLRDKLMVGALDGAHMLAPAPLAVTLGLGSEPAAMLAPLTLSLDGAAITVASRIAGGARQGAEAIARLVARRRDEGATPLTFAVVFPYSTHNFLLRAWLARAGIDPDKDVRLTVAPPPRMADLLADGVIEGFCAGEPWGAAAEASGAGRVVARATDIHPGAPDKVFAVTQGWARDNRPELDALLRAFTRASAWAADPENFEALVDLLARPDHVGLSPDLLRATLPKLNLQRDGGNRPTDADAAWLAEQLRRWSGAGPEAGEAALHVYSAAAYDRAHA